MASLRRLSAKLSAGVNPAVSCCRLRQVQSLLHQDGAGTGATSRPDGILCTLGIDSRYNEGCRELAEYLFYGLYGRSQLNVDQPLEEFPEEILDDVILLIKAECVHLYCNPTNYTHLLPHVSHWRNLHLYCMTEAEYEDEEAAEEFKISSFVAMVQDCHRIGVPYCSQGHMQRFDVFMVEKWPLIQAFALEGIGRGSLFTMKYKLVDMSEELWQVYNRLDPVSLNASLTQDLVTFEKQWSCFFSSMEQENHLSILELSEAQAGETFRTFFSHGLTSNNISDKSKARQPFVLFGSHSSSDELHNYSFNFASESHQVWNTGVRGSTAPHMVVQCVAPKAALSCSRTFFLGSTHTPYLGIQSSHPTKSPVLLLSQIYSAVVQAVLLGIQIFCRTGSTTKAAEVAEQTFLLSLDSVELSQLRPSLRSNCDFNIQAVDNHGRWIPLGAEESRYTIKTASMTVRDIPDMQGGASEQPLGSVVFSEAFMDSSINIQHRDGSMSTDNCYTVLTSSVPRYACWPLECDVALSKEAQHLAQREGPTCLGRPLSASAAAYLSSAGHLSTQEEGRVTFFSEGLLFVHAQYGAVTLCGEHVSAVRFYQPDCDGGVAALLVEYEAALLPHLPLALHDPQRRLLFGLPPGSAPSASLTTFCSKVVPVWKSSGSGLKLQTLEQDQLSWSLKNLHLRMQKLHDSQAPPVAKRRGSTKTCWQIAEQDVFLQHFALSSVSQEPILDQHLGALFPSAEPAQPATSCPRDQLVINIISGLAGSHKEELWSSLLRSRKELRSRCVLYPADGCGTFSVSGLHHLVSSLHEEQRCSGVTSRLLVLLLLSPGYCDVLEVVQVLLLHPDPAVRSRLTIGAVTACVDPLASCMEHRFAFPKLLEQCSQGVVSTVVWTGSAALTHPLVQHIQQLVRAANPTAAFLRAEEGGAISRSEEENLILSESSFNQPQMLRARYLLYPGWCRGLFQCGRGSLLPVQLRLTFSRPLEKTLFVAACRALRSSLSSAPFRGNVYNLWGRVKFSDSEQLVAVSYNTVSGSLDLDLDLDPGALGLSQPYLTFEGVGVTEEALRAWLTVTAGDPAHPPE